MNRYVHLPIYKIFRTHNYLQPAAQTNAKPVDIFMNNIKFLDDPKTGRKLILIGTYNTSNLMAIRTQKILEAAKPDKVLVETTPQWFENLAKADASLLKDNLSAQSVNEFNVSFVNYVNNLRHLIFKMKFYSWLFIASKIFPFADETGNIFRPGLEAFNVAKWAKDHKKDIVFSGDVFNEGVLEALKNEKRMYLPSTIYRSLYGRAGHYTGEYFGNVNEVSVHGMKTFTENATESRTKWLIDLYDAVIPHQKKIIVDAEDERIFNEIYHKLNGKVNVALVNAWHLPGIETHWRHTTGTAEAKEFINPIGDFDIDAWMDATVENDYLRRNKAHKGKTEPAVTSDYMSQYNKQNTEAERERHVFFAGHDDPELEHGLYNDENKNVKDLPYKIKHH